VLFTHGSAAVAFAGWTGIAVCGWVSVAEEAIVAKCRLLRRWRLWRSDVRMNDLCDGLEGLEVIAREVEMRVLICL
jgi:hypothetical protein